MTSFPGQQDPRADAPATPYGPQTGPGRRAARPPTLRGVWQRVADRRRIARYLAAGGCAAATHFVVLTALVEVGGVRPVVASGVGFLAGLVVSYLLQRAWVFRATSPHLRTGPRFALVVTIGLWLNTLVLWAGTEWRDHHYAVVQLVAFAAQPVNNYLWHSLWTFRPGRGH